MIALDTESTSGDFYRAAINELLAALAVEEDDRAADRLQAGILRMTIRMGDHGFEKMENRTANLRTLLADLHRITKTAEADTPVDWVRNLTAIASVAGEVLDHEA